MPQPTGNLADVRESGDLQRDGEAFLTGLVGRDFDALEACFYPEAHFRALTPRGLREATTAAGAVNHLKRWFGDTHHHEMLRSGVETIEDRLHLFYQFKVHDADGWQIVEQHAYADVREGRIVGIDLVCSGFRVMGSS